MEKVDLFTLFVQFWCLRGDPGTPPRHQNLTKKTQKVDFSHVPPKHQNGPQKSEIRPGNGFFVPREAAMRCQAEPASDWAKEDSVLGRVFVCSKGSSKRTYILF